MGKYAAQHGATAAAARKFSKQLGYPVRVSTVHSIKKAYVNELKIKRAMESRPVEINHLCPKKCGRSCPLGDALAINVKLQKYLTQIHEEGGSVSSRIVRAAARGILLAYDKAKLVEFGGHVSLSKQWAHSLLHRMNFVQRKRTTSKGKFTVENFAQVKEQFLRDVVTIVEMEDIPGELILNWDQTGIKMIPMNSWTMEQEGMQRVEMVGLSDKRQITAVFCGSILGDFLPIRLIYKGKTLQCHPNFEFPSEWHITHSPKHWSTEETMLQYIDHIIIPYVERC